MTVEPGWYADPTSPHHLRWWNGQQWAEQTQLRAGPLPTGGSPAVDPERAGDVWLLPQMVELGYLPNVCVRHGLPARRMQPAPVYSRTPWWVVPLGLVSLLLGLLIALALRETVWGPWPVCNRCLERRSRYRTAMWACSAATVLALVGAITVPSIALLLLAISTFVAAIAFRGLGDWYRVTSSSVARDRSRVHVRSPAASFVAVLPAAPPPMPSLALPPRRGW